MIKIYPEENIIKQIIVTSADFNLESETIFTLIKNSLNIDYLGMHIKIPNNEINKIEIKKNDNNNLAKIFINIKGTIKMEYIFFSGKNKIKDIYNFFADFK